MERLEPVLKQKFWILLGIGIIMTVTGWWLATGSLAAQITTRRGEIEGAEKKVPTGEIPNNDWSQKLAAINTEQDLAVKSTARGLWERQRAKMTWPETVDEFAWKNGYRGEIDQAGRVNYRTAYYFDVRRVWESVRPFNKFDGSGIVEFDPSKMPQRIWGDLTPSSAEMWDAQEDLWLLEGLFQSLVELNGGANSTRQDACLHVIDRLTLHGGLPAGQRKVGGAATASSSGGPAGYSGGQESFGALSGSGSGGGGAAGASGLAAVSADFDHKEELGDDGSGAAGGRGEGPSSSSSGFGGSSSSSGGPTATKTRRYVDDEDALPFKTRGFYLSVIMDHRKVPHLISALTANEKSAWPVEIIRVQVARLQDDDIEGRSGGGSSSNYLSSGSTAGYSSQSQSSSFGGGENPFGASTAESGFTAGFSPPGNSSGTSTTATPQALAGIAAFENALQDPYMAKVAVCGIITLYKEVKPEPVTAPPATPPTQPAPATAQQEAPAASEAAAETNASPSDQPADGAKPAAAANGEAAVPVGDAPSKSESPAKEEAPVDPGNPASPDLPPKAP